MKAQFSSQDFDSLQTAILELNSFRDLTEFRHALPGIMLRLIPADYFVWNEVLFLDGKPHASDFVESRQGVFLPFIARMIQVFPEHPFNKEFIESPDPQPLMFSDFYTLEELYQTRLYKVTMDYPDGWTRQLSVAVRLHPGLISSINFGDNKRDFTERDRAVLNMVKVHFVQAYRNAEAATANATASAQPLMRYQLTAREAEIGYWLAEGKSNPEIASLVNISPRTVEKHVENILVKLGAENRTRAAITIASAKKRPEHMPPGSPAIAYSK